MPRAVPVLVLAWVACAPAARPGGETAATPPAPGPRAVSTTGEPAPAPVAPPAAPASLQEVDGGAWQERSARARARRLRRGAWGAALAPGGDPAIVFGFGQGWVTRGGAVRLRLRQDLYDADFSPSHRRAAIVGARGFLVVDLERGEVVRRLEYADGAVGSPETVAVRFLSEDELAYFDGCTLRRVPVTGGEAVAVGPRLCGRPHPSDDGARWLLWTQDGDGRFAVHRLHADGADAETLLAGRGDPPGLSAFAAAPDASAFCYTPRRDRSELTCVDLERERSYLVSRGPTDGRLAFAGPDRVAFGAGPLRSERPLVLIDLAAGSRRTLGELGASEEWLGVLSPTRLVATGGGRALVFDLERRERLELALGRGEWEGLSVPEGGGDRFVLGKERRATRDLFWIELD